MLSIEEFRKLYEGLEGEPEFEFIFENREHDYMVIKYDDHSSFQRCGYQDGSGEIDYADIDSLLNADLIDGINLGRDWESVGNIVVNSTFNLAQYSDAADVLEELEEMLCS